MFGLQALDGAAGAQGIEESLVFTQAIEGELPGGAARLLQAHLTCAVPALEAVGGIDQRDLSVDNEGDPVAQLVGEAHVVVGDKDGGAVLAQPPDQRHHQPGVHGVEPAGRLVEKQQARAVHAGAGKVEPDLHAFAQGACALVGSIAQTDPVEGSVGIEGRPSVKGCKVAQAFQRGQSRIVVRQLEGDADLLIGALVPAPDFAPQHLGPAVVALQQADQDLLRGRLAGAGGAEKTQDFAVFEAEVQAPQCRAWGAGIGKAEVFDGDHGAELTRWKTF